MNRFALEITEDGGLRIRRYGMVLSRAEVAELRDALSWWLVETDVQAALETMSAPVSSVEFRSHLDAESQGDPEPEKVAGKFTQGSGV